MKKLMMVCSVFILMILAACGDIDEKNSREVKSSADVASETDEATETAKEEVEEKEKPLGTRSNPLPFGDTVTVKENIYDDSFNSYESFVDITLLETIHGSERRVCLGLRLSGPRFRHQLEHGPRPLPARLLKQEQEALSLRRQESNEMLALRGLNVRCYRS